jgi:threonine/homoserine/homoserine lactone efflux protein
MITHLIPSWPLFSAFVIASLILAITPGPGVLYIVTCSAAQGRRHGLISVAGMVIGNACNAIAASLGLAALFAISSMTFDVVKYAGAAYLIYMGIKAWRSPGNENTAIMSSATSKQIFRDGLFVALLNPKTTLFFAAFLPQFIDSSKPMYQSLFLGLVFVAIAAVTDSIYALVAASVVPAVRHRITWGRKFGALIFIGLGLFTALGSVRSNK